MPNYFPRRKQEADDHFCSALCVCVRAHCFHHNYPIRYCQKFIGCNAMQVWKYLLHCLREKDASKVYILLSSSANSPCTRQHNKRNIISIKDTVPVLNRKFEKYLHVAQNIFFYLQGESKKSGISKQMAITPLKYIRKGKN